MVTIETKKCIICNKEKSIDIFCKDKSRKDGLNNKCKVCVKEYNLKNKEHLKKYIDEYNKKNKKELAVHARERRRVFRATQKEKYNKQNRKYYAVKNSKKEMFLILFFAKNPTIIDYYNKRENEKKTIYKVRDNVRSRINQCIKNKNNKSWQKITGYSIAKLRKHLEKQFKPGMCWDNYGEWHIDHIIPISKYNIKSIEDEDFKRCWSLKNLQPLWAAENITKGDKIDSPVQQSFSFSK